MGIYLHIELTNKHINIERDITLPIVLPSENFTSDSQLIVYICVRNDLQVGVCVSIEQVTFSFWDSFNGNDIKTVLSEVRVVLVENHAIGIVWLDLELFVIDLRLIFLQQLLELFASCLVHVNVCLAVLQDG